MWERSWALGVRGLSYWMGPLWPEGITQPLWDTQYRLTVKGLGPALALILNDILPGEIQVDLYRDLRGGNVAKHGCLFSLVFYDLISPPFAFPRPAVFGRTPDGIYHYCVRKKINVCCLWCASRFLSAHSNHGLCLSNSSASWLTIQDVTKFT